MNAPRVLILVTVWPEPESSAAGMRVFNVIDAFKRFGHEVEVGSPCKENEFSRNLIEKGIRAHPLPMNDSAFDEWIKHQDFDIAVLDRFVIEEQFGWRIAEHSPRTMRVLDTEDLHFLRRAREAALKSGATLNDIFSDRIELDTEDALREIASIYRSDLTLVLSDHEISLLTSRFQVPIDLLTHFPFCYPSASASPKFEERSNFVSIGNFRHPPNADAVRWMKSTIWPAIKSRLSDRAELHIYGAYPSKEFMEMTNATERFFVKGPAQSSIDTLKNYRVSLAPLRFGAGIKGKISDSWQAGTPVVTTPIGAEGMRMAAHFGGEIAGDESALAASAAQLYSQADRWQNAIASGRVIMREKFSFEKNADNLVHAIGERRTSLESFRKRNFVGRMLSHHTLRSTKYFSKWIELKEQAASKTVNSTGP